MADDPDTKIRKKAGRPKGAKNKGGRPRDSGIALREQRKYDISLNQSVRDGVHPDILREFFVSVIRGRTPVLVTRDGVDYIEQDPNPLLPAPTYEQRERAAKWLSERGWGQPSQSVTIDAEFRNKVELQLTGITQQQLEAFSLKSINAIRKLIKLPSVEDIIDAELVETNDNKPALPEGSES